MQIGNLNNFSYRMMKIDQGLPYTIYLRGTILNQTYSTLFTMVNISDEPGFT